MQLLADTIGTSFLSGAFTSHSVAAGQEGGDVPKKGLFSLPFMERAMQRRKQQAHSEALELLKASGALNLKSRVMHEPAGQGPSRPSERAGGLLQLVSAAEVAGASLLPTCRWTDSRLHPLSWLPSA